MSCLSPHVLEHIPFQNVSGSDRLERVTASILKKKVTKR